MALVWYKRYEDLFSVDLAAQEYAWNVRLLLRKQCPAEHKRYANFILPKNPRNISFADTLKALSQIFCEQYSLLNARFQCLRLCKRESDDFVTYAGIVNRECRRFQLGSFTEDQFKCLIFICGLHSPKDADIRTCLLSHEPEEDNVIAAISIKDEVRRQLSDAIRGIPVNTADSRRATATIAFHRRVFSQYGLPHILVSDNWSQFTSSTFADFCRQHPIQHLRSPPTIPNRTVRQNALLALSNEPC
ncbi:unnamed protein product [Dibothriocephalus latus]|uniref:Integrase catalytic domain-containing protein n=1 Tax=Dibothriocephalus latus TaxID=60516 RepID=A0A3P6TZE3_DIBLA|nr:unnamed protein product [Dibothriocephalus latus]